MPARHWWHCRTFLPAMPRPLPQGAMALEVPLLLRMLVQNTPQATKGLYVVGRRVNVVESLLISMI